MKTWVAVISRTEARLFEIREKKLKLVKKLENPRGRLKNIDINADRPGISAQSFTFARGRLAKQQEPTDRVAQIFAKSISEELEKALNDHLFDDLILVVEAHYLGTVRAALSKKTIHAIRRTLKKDLAKVSDDKVARFIWPESEEPRSSL